MGTFDNRLGSMNILHLTKVPIGGAFVAANRISESLNQIGHESKVEVLQDYSFSGINISQIQGKIDFLNESFSAATMTTSILRAYSSSKYAVIDFNHVDVVNLHWVPGLLHQNFIDELRKVKRVVWTMHDMSTFTGICHHASECRNFEERCNPCPQFLFPKVPIASGVLEQKMHYLRQLSGCSFVAPSEWLRGKALSSRLLRDQEVSTIPNPTSDELLHRVPNEMLKKRIGLSGDKLIVGILGSNYGVQKGGREALKALISFCRQTEIEVQVVIFGERYPDLLDLPFVTTREFPTIDFEGLLQICDLYVHMSEFENLPNIIIEAQSLGVPVVALDRGGISETILVGETGYVLKDGSEFHHGMNWFLAASKEPNFKNRIRSFAKTRFEPVKIANEYLEVYSR